jgi:hypothetical protein
MSPSDSYARILIVAYRPSEEMIRATCQMQFSNFDIVQILIDDKPFETTIINHPVDAGRKNLQIPYTMFPGNGVNVKVQITTPFGQKFVTEPGMPLVYNPSNNPNAGPNMMRYMY